MTTVLLFIFVVVGTSGWWLSHQRLGSKPWLESGLDSVSGTDRIGLPKAKMGLIVFLGVAGILFALFTSGFFMRSEMADWKDVPLPGILWVTTGLLVLASFALQTALRAARNGELSAVKNWLALAGMVTFGFLAGQSLAWQQLMGSGFVFNGNPANSFFYLLTGLHGLHILGGVVGLARTMGTAWSDASIGKLTLRVDLCALYWHFLLFVWIALVIAMQSWAHDPFIVSHH